MTARARIPEGTIKITFIFIHIYYCDSEFLLEVGHRFRVRTIKRRWGPKMDFSQLIGPITHEGARSL